MCPLQVPSPRGRVCSPALAIDAGKDGSHLWKTWTRSSRNEKRRPMSSTPRAPTPRPPPEEKDIQRQALAGMLLEQADLFVGRRSVAGGRQSQDASAGISQADPQRPLAACEFDARSFHARQVGIPLVRRLGSGIPVHHARRWSIRSLPRRICGFCCSNSSSIRTARSPPTSGSFPI